ncbi:MAG: aminotransferase class I/II-fold pyridoxal phosphate-dependent enzyme [Rhizobiales bacterium]|nr:aminotransferase class I/II-fold pyridoxal phosphate-dependent enzyme [Hyphomicrobiales bacterium]
MSANGEIGGTAPANRGPEPHRDAEDWATHPRPSPTLALAEAIEVARRAGRDVLSISTPTFPEHALDPKVVGAASCRLSPAEGAPELRRASRDALFSRWQLPEHSVLVTAGAKAGLFCALKSGARPGSAVVVVAPAWPSYGDIVRMAGLSAHVYETRARDGFAIEADGLERAMVASGARTIVLSNPSNPTGRILEPAELMLLTQAAERHDAELIIDESFSDIMFEESAWQNSVAPGNRRIVILNSFSKNFHLQGLRVAACLAHQSRAGAIVACHQTLFSAAPSVSQAIALAALDDKGRIPPSAHYGAAREVALEIIARAGWRLSRGGGTFYFFPSMTDAQRTIAAMQEAGIYALSGAAFGDAYGDHLRVCYGKPVAEMIAIRERLAAAGIIGRG